MKIKIMIKLIIIIFLFGIISSNLLIISYASNTGTVYLTSSQDVIYKGEELEINVYIKNVKTVAFNFSLYFDDSKLEYIAELNNVNVVNNRIIFVWYDENGGNGAKDGVIAQFRFKAKENGVASFRIDGEFYNESAQLINIDYEEKQVQIQEKTNNLLKSSELETNLKTNSADLQELRVNIEGITPNFESDIYEYYLTVQNYVESLEVTAISEGQNANIQITGNTNLKEGLNIITIKVTSEDKTQNNIYKINVTKTGNIELANSNLEILAIENVLLNPPFYADIMHYKAEVAHDVKSINIFAVPENEKATVEIYGKDNINEGNNLISVIVTAPNGYTKKTYQVELYKRNIEEEYKYQEEQNLQKQKLDEAYEIEKVSENSSQVVGNDEVENVIEAEEKQNVSIGIIVILSIIIVLLIIVFLKKKIDKDRF